MIFILRYMVLFFEWRQEGPEQESIEQLPTCRRSDYVHLAKTIIMK